MSSVQILNFVEIASMAMLAVVDGDAVDFGESPSGVEIVVNNKFLEMLNYHVGSYCRNYRQYGVRTVVVNSCSPFNNWRKEERGSPIRASKYQLTDPDCFAVDKQRLENALERIWKRLIKGFPDIVFLQAPSVDFYDMLEVVEKHVGTGVVVHPFRFFFLRDVNCEYMHVGNIPDRIVSDIDAMLRENQLIL